MKKVAVYARVSSDDQKVSTQLLPLREYCKRQGYARADEYIDQGFSGKDDKKPEFERLLRNIRANKVDCVITWKIDRIGRSLFHLLNFLSELRKRGIGFVSTTENIDTTTAHGELIWHILGAVAQYERSIIVQRTKAGLDRARKEGKILGRPKGSRDKKRRRMSGYLRRWSR